MNTPALSWSVNALTAAKVRRYAIDADDERLLLDILGIVDDCGNVLPDDVRNYDVEGNAPDSGSTIGWRRVVPEPPTDRRHVPAGLREAS